MNVVRCAHCGTANRAGSNFCNRCGTDLRVGEDAGELSPETPAQHTQPPAIPHTAAHGTDDSAAPDDQIRQPRSGGERSAGSAEESRQARTEEEHRQPGSVGAPPERLVDGITGLLEPIRITSELSGDETHDATTEQSAVSLPDLTIPVDQLRRIRTLFAEDPTLVEHHIPIAQSSQIRLRYPWLITLFLLALGLPLLLGLTGPVGEARRWPGVTEAYAAIDQLATDELVWIYWAYDPATAGEMDLLALPLVDHLLERNAQSTIISLLPTGLATAERLWREAASSLLVEQGIGIREGRTVFVEGAYLPGGAGALALLASAPEDALWGYTERATSWLAFSSTQRPALSVVVAAHAEDVQQWLEMVQTETQLPVVAFTGAGADPIVRPYLASGQLAGLVSGFDGAAAYQQLRDRRFGRLPSTRYTAQLIAQNWGHIALILLLLLGNLRALWLGGKRG